MIAGRILPVCIIFLLVSALSSCDFLRKMAGRPTSPELALLEKKRDSLEIERRLKHKRPVPEQADTATGVPAPDSVSQIQILKAGSGSVLLYNVSRFRGCKQARQLFYIIAGTFKEADNAERYAARLQKDAFSQAQVLTLGNGYSLTAVYGADKAEETMLFLSEHKSELPSEAWILINDLR